MCPMGNSSCPKTDTVMVVFLISPQKSTQYYFLFAGCYFASSENVLGFS